MRNRGFTILEMVVALAILGILLGLSITAASALGRSAAPQTAAADLSARLSQARATAVEKSVDVWVIFFETLTKNGSDAGGQGGYIILSDPDFTFGGLTPAPVTGEWRFPTMPVPNCNNPTKPTAGRVKVLHLECFESYGGANAKMADVGAAPASMTLPAPFVALNPVNRMCSFCNGTPAKGAVVFGDNGQARFVDGSGAISALRSGYFGLASRDGGRAFLFAVSGPTSFVQSYAY